MLDELEALLKSAKRQAYHERVKKEAAKPLLLRSAPKHQADLEWTLGKTICLIHKDSNGTETALGLFTEHLRGSSRWLRPTAESLSPDHAEIVTGTWWLHPTIREIPVDTPHEVLAIRSRFEMLMNEFEPYFAAEHFPLTDLPLDPDDEDEDEWDDEDEDEEFEDDENEEEEE